MCDVGLPGVAEGAHAGLTSYCALVPNCFFFLPFLVSFVFLLFDVCLVLDLPPGWLVWVALSGMPSIWTTLLSGVWKEAQNLCRNI